MDAHSGPNFPNQYSHPVDYLQSEPDPDGLDSFVAPISAHPSASTTGGAIDLRPRDGTSTTPSPWMRNEHETRYGPDSGLASDNSYRAGNNFSDPTSHSIPVSPSLGSAQYGYNNVHSGAVHHYTNLPTRPPNPLLHPGPSYHPYREAGGIDTALPSPLPLPSSHFPRPSLASPLYPGERNLVPPTHLLNPIHLRGPVYLPSYDTSRPCVPSTGPPYSGHPYVNQMNSPRQSNANQGDWTNFPWPNLECYADLTCNGQKVSPDIQVGVEKGFFQDKGDGKWTCYRRNYFGLHCSFTLSPNIDGGDLYVTRNGRQEKVKAIALRISAAVDGQNGKAVELIQHTPKRDAGPKSKVRQFKMLPKQSTPTTQQVPQPLSYGQPHMMPFHQTGHVAAPSLDFQYLVDPETNAEPGTQTANATNYSAAQAPQTPPGQETLHLFERIQFKCATANNGKRRASQQFFHLDVELVVDVRENEDDEPIWVTVARRTSGNIVVRGRSPSHYQNESGAANNGGNTRGNTGAGRRSSAPPAPMPNPMAYGQVPMRSSPMGPSSTSGAPTSYSAYTYGPNTTFRPESLYALHESSGESSHSPDSNDGDAFDAEHQPTAGVLPQSTRLGIPDINRYSYHPGAIYDPVLPVHHLPPPRTDGQLRGTTDPRSHAFRSEFPEGAPGSQYYYNGGISRYSAFDTSRNVYPDASGGAPSYS